MSRPKRHKFVVEITDMSGRWSASGLAHAIRYCLTRRLKQEVSGLDFANIQVKNLNRVLAAEKSKGQGI